MGHTDACSAQQARYSAMSTHVPLDLSAGVLVDEVEIVVPVPPPAVTPGQAAPAPPEASAATPAASRPDFGPQRSQSHFGASLPVPFEDDPPYLHILCSTWNVGV